MGRILIFMPGQHDRAVQQDRSSLSMIIEEIFRVVIMKAYHIQPELYRPLSCVRLEFHPDVIYVQVEKVKANVQLPQDRRV